MAPLKRYSQDSRLAVDQILVGAGRESRNAGLIVPMGRFL